MINMKKLAVATSLFLFTLPVYAATCDYKERASLNSEVANVKANYEIKERTLDPSEYSIPDEIIGTEEEATYVAKEDYIEVSILNLSENMYLEITNNKNDEKLTYTYANTQDGSIIFNRYEIGELITYTIKVYASSSTGCEGTALKTLYLALPRFNDYSSTSICEKLKDNSLCEKYVMYDKIEYDDFYKRVSSAYDGKLDNKKMSDNKEESWLAKHKELLISGGVILVVAIGGATYVIIKKRRRGIL